MSHFEWTEQRSTAALGLAEGKTHVEVAEECDIDRRTIHRWLQDPEFSAEVDRLSLMVGIAGRAHRLRLAQRVVRRLAPDSGEVMTEKDLLDWLKFAQSETDGIKLDLAKLAAVLTPDAPVAPSGSD